MDEGGIRKMHITVALRDFARLFVRAFMGGLGAAVAMALAILALSANTHAATIAPPEAVAEPEPWSAALAPDRGVFDAPGAGALWAMGLGAAGAALAVALAGRRG